MATLELRGVGKTYRNGIKAAQAVDLTIPAGSLGVIVGPSGSGKSTLLRLIAGLEPLDAGSIHLAERRIDGLAPRDRDLAMVFQDVVVYPHLDVFENIAFGLRARRLGRAEVQARVEATAALLGLEATLRRSPTTLSGGQKRRVTLARALVLRPRLFLFDEPFAGLDAPLRTAIRGEIAEIHRQTGATMVLVTHDQAEALALADQVAVFDAGQVIQVGPPLDIYRHPRTEFVARFIGQPPMALLPCTLNDHGPAAIRVELAEAAATPWLVDQRSPLGTLLGKFVGRRIHLGIRAEQVTPITGPVDSTAQEPGGILATAQVVGLEPTGREVGATITIGPHRLSTWLPARASVAVGSALPVRLDLAAASWFDLTTGDRLTGSGS